MHLNVISRVIGILLMAFSLTMVVPALISLVTGDGAFMAFGAASVVTFGCGLLMWLFVRGAQEELSVRDGFLVVSAFWVVLSLFSSLPFMLSEVPHLSISDAVFEAVSGFTTTGSTVITGLDHLPVSILFYRQLMQWLGGIGIIVIAIAILPMLGIGGMQLYQAEMPGPTKDKLTPRIADTAKTLFGIYLGLTIACGLSYWFAGMSAFDAVCHALATVSTGGFSPHDASMGYFYDNPAILMLCSFFMLLGGISFSLHFVAWSAKSPLHYLRDAETQFYLGALALGCFVIGLHLLLTDTYTATESALMAIFHTVSITTSTGFGADNFAAWPSYLPILLIFMAFMGGCAGSTGGGMKVMRIMLLAKLVVREIKQLVHPNAVIPLKVGPRRVEAKVASAVWSFVAVYMFSFVLIVLALMTTGLDYYTAFSATATTINNLGPGLGEVAVHFGGISNTAKWVLCYAMLLGRLEVFTLLVLLTPAFWRR